MIVLHLLTLKGSNLNGNYFNLYDTYGNMIDSVIKQSLIALFFPFKCGIYNYQTSHSGSCNTHNQDIYIIQPDEVIADFSTISDTFFLDTNSNIEIHFKNNSFRLKLFLLGFW